MNKYDSPMPIVSAHIAELEITFGQQTVYDKSNEIPAVRERIDLLNIEGCIVVPDVPNCQKETANAIIRRQSRLFVERERQSGNPNEDISEYVQDDDLCKTMDTYTTLEKDNGRIERRTTYVTSDIQWLYGKKD